MANAKVRGATNEWVVMSAGALDAEFESWWLQCPLRVGKLAARKAYEKARAQATSGELLAGIERYRQTKPAYAEWCHPRTWLSQGRWMDAPAAPSRQQRGSTAAFVPDHTHHEWRERRDAEARQKAAERWDALAEEDRRVLRTRIREQLRTRFKYTDITPDMVDAACVLELQS